MFGWIDVDVVHNLSEPPKTQMPHARCQRRMPLRHSGLFLVSVSSSPCAFGLAAYYGGLKIFCFGPCGLKRWSKRVQDFVVAFWMALADLRLFRLSVIATVHKAFRVF